MALSSVQVARSETPVAVQHTAAGARLLYSRRRIFAAGSSALLVGVVSLALFEGLQLLLACALGLTMLAIAISDARRFIVPDVLSLPAIPFGILASGLLAGAGNADGVIIAHALAAVAGAGGFWAVRHGFQLMRGYEGLGLGDVKLAAVAGAWTGWQGLAPVVLAASLAAMAFVLASRRLAGRHVTEQTKIPFGAFLAPAIWLVWSLAQIG